MMEEDIKEIIRKHQLWLQNKSDGKRADFGHANLSHADLCETDLFHANLSHANLFNADLFHANLCETDLFNANLCETDLCETDLFHANLCETDLFNANLFHANLCETDLFNANLFHADLIKIKINYLTRGIHPAPEGELIGWGKKNGKLVKLLIPVEAKRSCATTRKHRAEFVKVLWVEDNLPSVTVLNRFTKTVYKVGKTVRCHEWEKDRWKECAGGIHFFLSREEAELW